MVRMKLGAALLILSAIFATSVVANGEKTMVIMKTSMGNITLELYPEKAPATVENFLKYVDDGFYKDTIFHRVINTFMIQGGGFDCNLSKRSTRAAIKNEAANGLRNERGTIAMARTMVPDSATSQFFINTGNNHNLDFKNPSQRGIGYCVFGRVTDGMAVVDKIRAVATCSKGGMRDVPKADVVIEGIVRMVKPKADGANEKPVESQSTPEADVVPLPAPEIISSGR